MRVAIGGATSDIPVDGVFVYIGLKPEAEFLGSSLALDADGAIPTDSAMRTSLKGVCAAGMVRMGAAGRAAASAGDGSVAAISIDRLFGGKSSFRLVPWVVAYLDLFMIAVRKLPRSAGSAVRVRIPAGM